jgi:hypothetical protein
MFSRYHVLAAKLQVNCSTASFSKQSHFFHLSAYLQIISMQFEFEILGINILDGYLPSTFSESIFLNVCHCS